LVFQVYLPPCYEEGIDQDYPTLYMLHGLHADASQWLDLGITEIAANLISSGQVEPFIIVLPTQKAGVDLESAVIDELVPYIDNVYRSQQDPAFRAIGGLSRGGGSALRIGLKHPDIFGNIGLHSPATFYDLVYVTLWIRGIPKDDLPRIWIDIGKDDSLRESTLALIATLDELEVAYTSLLPEGDHTAAYWSAHLEDYLRWYTSLW
jgi:enterochelin esterase family protein